MICTSRMDKSWASKVFDDGDTEENPCCEAKGRERFKVAVVLKEVSQAFVFETFHITKLIGIDCRRLHRQEIPPPDTINIWMGSFPVDHTAPLFEKRPPSRLFCMECKCFDES